MKGRCNVCGQYNSDMYSYSTEKGDFTAFLCEKSDCNRVFRIHLHKSLQLDKIDKFKEYYKLY